MTRGKFPNIYVSRIRMPCIGIYTYSQLCLCKFVLMMDYLIKNITCDILLNSEEIREFFCKKSNFLIFKK